MSDIGGMIFIMALSLDEWFNQTANRYWDMDGAYGAQCWDLWAKYSMDLYGASIQDCITPTGYAEGCYTAFPYSAKLSDIYDKKGADYNPVKGDVVFWTYCADYPSSHVAIVWDGVDGNRIDVMTQNPEPSQHKKLTLAKGVGLLGYLHPKTLPTTPSHGDNQTGTDNKGDVISGEGSDWVQLQGDLLLRHYNNGGVAKIQTFVKSTAQTWIARGTSGTPSADSGQAHPSVGDGASSYALYVIGTVESSLRWNAVEAANRQGIGIAQWSFERRLQVLNAMRKVDTDGYNAFAQVAPDIAALMQSGGVFDRPLTEAEAEAFRAWASRPQSHDGQRTQFAEDYANYPQIYDNDKMQIMWVSAHHQSPARAAQLAKATSLSGLRDIILADAVLGGYPERYNNVYSLLNIWDGHSAPPNF